MTKKKGDGIATKLKIKIWKREREREREREWVRERKKRAYVSWLKIQFIKEVAPGILVTCRRESGYKET